MKIWQNERLLLDTDSYKLNFGILNFDDYKSATEKLIKTDSFGFNDSYVYETGTYEGYSTTLDFFIRDIKRDEFLKFFREGNRLSLPKEQGLYREYYIEGAIKTSYYREGYQKISIPVYFNAFKYSGVTENVILLSGTVKEITNIGDVYAEPIYTVYGNGDLTFSLNGESHILRNAQRGYKIICKNKEQDVTDLDGIPKNITSDYKGNFPILKPGVNRLQLIKGERLVLQVNWRWRD